MGKSEKLIKGNLIIMDVNAIPMEHGIDTEKWAYMVKENGILFYDSVYGGANVDKPRIVNISGLDNKEMTVKIVDLSTKEGKAILDELPKYTAGADPYDENGGSSKGSM